MAGVSAYERLQIESLLQPAPPPPIEPGSGLAIFGGAHGSSGRRVYDMAIAPAMRAAGLNHADVALVFDESSSLAMVCRHIQFAQVIVADLTEQNPSVMYVLGLAHALGRCPILITAGGEATLPFNFAALRHITYPPHKSGLLLLREHLGRALRVFLTAAGASDAT